MCIRDRIHGDEDDRAKWAGQRDTLGVEDTMAYWLEAHRCGSRQSRLDWMPDLDPDDGTHPELYRYENCQDVPALHLYKVKGGGHAWPSMKGVGKKREGNSRDMDATEATLAFWQKHAGLEWDAAE